MIEISAGGWAGWLLAMLICSVAGVALSRFLPWSHHARNVSLPFFFGLSLAPFILGFAALLALTLLAGASHAVHRIFLFALLAAVTAAAFYFAPKAPPVVHIKKALAFHEYVTLALLFAFAAFLILSTLFLPLIQIDSLEYATVGRILFDSRTLASYPALQPDAYASGFYGPWTHPPLYVALIYAAYLLQGQANDPGLLTLISPWFALAATGLMFATGALINRRTGLLAALLILSTPLFSMGAQAALIDPLSVVGLTLVFISIFAFDAAPKKRALVQGSILAIALWTHSQAILFPALLGAGLLFYHGAKHWKMLLRQIPLTALPVLLFGIWPYVRNFTKLGSLISDDPLVFNLPQLAWNDFFLIGRGVNLLTAKIQYGLLKGWFAPESYGLVFWLMLMGVVLLYFRRSLCALFLGAAPQMAERKRILWSAFGIILLYHAGIIFSLLIGSSQMIRIERYMLILLPCVTLIAGFTLASCFQPLPIFARRQAFKHAMFGSFVLLLLAIQLGALCWQQLHSNGLQLETLSQPQQVTLLAQPEQRVMAFLKAHTAPDAVVLALKPADMYYSDRRMVSYLDPRLVPFYEATTPERGLAILKALGITHVYSVSHSLPPYYNSTLQTILGNPKLATLLYTADGNQLYALAKSPLTAGPAVNITPGVIPWKKDFMVIIGGRKQLASFRIYSKIISNNTPFETDIPLSLFQRDISTILKTGFHEVRAQPNMEYRLTTTLEGYGLMRLWLMQFDKDDRPLEGNGDAPSGKMLLGEIILGRESGTKTFPFRFHTYHKTAHMRLMIEYYGNAQVVIKQASISVLH